QADLLAHRDDVGGRHPRQRPEDLVVRVQVESCYPVQASGHPGGADPHDGRDVKLVRGTRVHSGSSPPGTPYPASWPVCGMGPVTGPGKPPVPGPCTLGIGPVPGREKPSLGGPGTWGIGPLGGPGTLGIGPLWAPWTLGIGPLGGPGTLGMGPLGDPG